MNTRLRTLAALVVACLIAGAGSSAGASGTLPDAWEPSGLGGGGGMFSPAISPHDPNVMFLAIDMGHVFRTRDAGASWQVLPFQQIEGQQQTQVQFTSTPSTIYAAERGRDPIAEGNVFRPKKSQDLGDHWSSFPSWPPATYPSERAVSVWADPNRDDSFLVASDARLWFYRSGGTSGNFTLLYTFPSGNARVGGVHWSSTTPEVWVGSSDGLLHHSDPFAGGSFSLAVSPPSGNKMISFAGARQGGVLRFYCVTTQMPVDATKTPQSFSGGSSNRVYHMDWPQDSAWTIEGGIPAADYPVLVGMAGNRVDCAHVAVARSASYPNQHSIYRQDGPGAPWTRTMLTEGNGNLHTGWGSINANSGPVASTLETNISYSFPCGMAVSAVDADRVVICDNCVIHRSDNAAQASPVWQQIYTTPDNPLHGPGELFPHGQSYQTGGLELTVAYWVDWSSASDVFIGALDYQCPHSLDGGMRWGFDYDPTTLPSGDIPQVVSDPLTGTRYAICTYANTLYEFLGTDDLHVDNTGPAKKPAPGLWSLPPGATQWVLVRNDFGVGEPGSPLTRGANPCWVVVDSPRRRLYVAIQHSNPAADGIYQNDLTTGAWKKLPSPAPGAFRPAGTAIVHPFNIRILANGDLLVSYSARQAGNANAGYTPSSGVFLYSQSAGAWTDKSTRIELRYFTRDVVVDPGDPAGLTWYACVSNTDLATTVPASADAPTTYGGLYKTIDGGGSWTLVWNGQTGVAGQPGTAGCSVISVTVHPTNRYELWMTTRFAGLWISQDRDAANPTFQQTSYPFRAPERVFFNPYSPDEVWITSNGYGLSITSRPQSFLLWQKDRFGLQAADPLVAGESADPDGDGLSNLLEYSMGGDPLAAASAPRPALSLSPSGDFLSLTFQRIADPFLTYSVEASNDLLDWGAAPIWSSTGAANVAGTTTVTDSANLAVTPRRFLRLRMMLQ
ncbi:MAG: hypothetical protein NTV93_11640 [Verrucomicrobia bacterium]|nr:hypothetical protein [Verrucomicrobiota bacterium]